MVSVSTNTPKLNSLTPLAVGWPGLREHLESVLAERDKPVK